VLSTLFYNFIHEKRTVKIFSHQNDFTLTKYYQKMDTKEPDSIAIKPLRFNHENYKTWVNTLVKTIETAKLQTSLKVNSDLLQLYFTLGNEILEKQEKLGWGKQIIDLLSADLQKRYSGESGYSIRNLKYMRQFAKEYPDFPIVQVSLAQLNGEMEFVQVPLCFFAYIDLMTWSHLITVN